MLDTRSSVIQLPSAPIESDKYSLQYLYWTRLGTIKLFFLKIECIEYLKKPITTVPCSKNLGAPPPFGEGDWVSV